MRYWIRIKEIPMLSRGIPLSVYIEMLQELQKKYGPDVRCYTDGGTDYPEAASGPYVKQSECSYTPKGAIVLA